MSGFRLVESTDVADLFGATEEELAAPSMFEEHYPDPKKIRWHCGQCGRFVPFATVRKIPPSGPDWVDEHGCRGVCKTHGEVDVTWGQQ